MQSRDLWGRRGGKGWNGELIDIRINSLFLLKGLDGYRRFTAASRANCAPPMRDMFLTRMIGGYRG